MAVYDKNGNELSFVYDKNGNQLAQAYDKDGNPLIDVEPLENNFVVMSYNVQWFSGLNSNQSMQQQIIETYNPDIIGLQELTRTSTMPTLGETLFAGYTYQSIGNQQNKTALVSKKELDGIVKNTFTSQASEVRGYNKAYFRLNGKTICWINTHLETSTHEATKVAQAEEVFDMAQNEEYFIITGDFNTVCKSVSDTEYTTIMKQFVDAGYNVANCSEQFGFKNTWTDGSTASGTWYPCDHIITSENITINNVIVDTTKIDVASSTGYAIDHLPIIAYLII